MATQTIDGVTADFQNGGWYQGRQYWNGSLGAPGVINNPNQSGYQQKVSNDVIAQTNPNNVSYIDNQIKATQLQAPTNLNLPSTSATAQSVVGLNAEVEAARKALETTLAQQKLQADQKYADLQLKEQQTLSKVGELTTPFRADLEAAQREKLYINQNFEANQTLINELDTLLTQGNEAIKQQQSVTGLAAVRNPRIQKTMDDVAARAGVIQAVISARNGQIAQAETLIDRSVNAIAADRQDQISYYNTILELNRRDMVSLDETSKKLAEEQLNLKKNDLDQAQTTANYVKQLLLNPTTAGLMGQAGVTLTDSVETINSKLSQAQYVNDVRDMNNKMATSGYVAIFDPAGYSKDQLVTVTDSRGNKYYFKKPVSETASSNSLADGFILSELGKKTQTTTTPVQKVDQDSLNIVKNIASQVVAPMFSATVMGQIYTDQLGRKWQWDVNGWVLLN